MSRFTETLAKHRMTYRPGPTARVGCSCTWVSDHPTIITDPALWEAHVESVLAGAGVVAVELPAQSGDPFRARDIVERAAIMRQQYRAELCAGPLSWGRATDAQKVHWIIRAAADLSAAAVCPVTPGEPT